MATVINVIDRNQPSHAQKLYGRRPWADNPFRAPDWFPPDDAYAHCESDEHEASCPTNQTHH
jgi:hypothetical protein